MEKENGKLKIIVREVLLLPAHLIWVAWRGVGDTDANMSFLQIWKCTKDEFITETSKGGRFAFSLVGSIGIYALCIERLIRSF